MFFFFCKFLVIIILQYVIFSVCNPILANFFALIQPTFFFLFLLLAFL